MALDLVLGETKFYFSIDGAMSNRENRKDIEALNYWVLVSVTVRNQFFDYKNLRDESLEYLDLLIIRDSFSKLLNDEIEKPETIAFIEPYYEFTLNPKLDLRTIGHTCAEGYEIQDISVDFIINLHDSNAAFNGQKYILPCDREEIIAWRDYLNEAIIEFDARNNSSK
jgi:hypothetical protein